MIRKHIIQGRYLRFFNMYMDIIPVGDRRIWGDDDGSDTVKSDPKSLLSQTVNKRHPLHLLILSETWTSLQSSV